jgi:signal transduction histidine kinase
MIGSRLNFKLKKWSNMQNQMLGLTPDKLSTAILLERAKENIMSVWAVRARELFPAAEGQSTPALQDALPQLLDQIINALSLVGFSSDARNEISTEHAQQRASLSGYTLKQVLSEMRVLRETIFEILEKDGTELAHRERDIILDSIEKGIITTGTEFVKLQMEEKAQELKETKEIVDQLESEQRLRDLFVATLTHDLKNPLTAARLNIEMIKRILNDSEAGLKLISRTINNLGRTEQMIDSLLDANQIRTGNPLHFQMAKYDVVSQIAQLVDEAKQLHVARIFQLEVPGHNIICEFAADKIGRAIENFLTNAIKYGEPSKPITVSVKELSCEIKISVHNFGNPIPEHEQSAVFEPFFRAKSVRFGNQKGWGLGLTLVQGIVEAHSGKIELVSNLEQGTTFSLILPKITKSSQV